MKKINDKMIVNMAKTFYKNRKNTNVRAIANEFNISKSSVHKVLTKDLKRIDIILYNKCKKVLEYNKSVRHIRGGISTKNKYKHNY